MKKIKIEFRLFKKLIDSYRECKRKVRFLNKQIKEYNEKFSRDKDGN